MKKKNPHDEISKGFIEASTQIKQNSLKKSFFESEIPKEGHIVFFSARKLLKEAFLNELNSLKAQEKKLKLKQESLLQDIKKEHIELEKFKILHQDEINKRLKILKKQEENFLDEIGTIRFWRDK